MQPAKAVVGALFSYALLHLHLYNTETALLIDRDSGNGYEPILSRACMEHTFGLLDPGQPGDG